MLDRPYADRFPGKDNYREPKSKYIAHIATMDEDVLLQQTQNKIWLAAFANNNPRSDYHWHVDVLYAEWKFRGKLDQYQVAWDKAYRSEFPSTSEEE